MFWAPFFDRPSNLNFIPRACIVKISNDTGYEPDIIVLDETEIADEPRWERESIITLARSIKLVVEVVSTNWRDDYLVKLADYEAMGILEYWIVDYLGIGGRRYIGSPYRAIAFSVSVRIEVGQTG